MLFNAQTMLALQVDAGAGYEDAFYNMPFLRGNYELICHR